MAVAAEPEMFNLEMAGLGMDRPDDAAAPQVSKLRVAVGIEAPMEHRTNTPN
jgi:hypothetical protein